MRERVVPECLDSAVLEQLRVLAGPTGTPLLLELLQMFSQQTPARLQRLAEAQAAGDLLALEGEAHTLRGNAGALGALRLHEACGALELAARCRDSAALPGLVLQVTAAAHEALTALAAEAGRL